MTTSVAQAVSLGSKAGGQPPVLRTKDEAIGAVRELTARFRERALQTETDRRVPDSTIAELTDAGLFGIVTPKVFGGSEIGLEALVNVTTEVAAACGSSGWVYGVLAGHSWMLNLFPVKAQEDVFANPRALTATVFRLGGSATPVDGGYHLVGGEGRFCSGIDHADWVIIGNTVKRPDGSTEPWFFVVPRSEVEVIDDWYTMGMRGTGSRSIKIADTFIPAHRAVSAKDLSSGKSEGAAFHRTPFYQMPFTLVAPFSIVGAPLGMATGIIEDYAAGQTGKLASADEIGLSRAGASLARLAEAATTLDAAKALVTTSANFVLNTDPAQLSSRDKERMPRNWSFAVQSARHAANRVFEAAGGSTIYNDSVLQRHWRDLNACSQHIAFAQDDKMVNYGRTMVGREPVPFALPKK